LAPGWHGFYLHLRAGFDRLGQFPLGLTFIRLPAPAKLREHVRQHQTVDCGATIAAIYRERRQP
jgi:hypothetical protein